MLYERYDVTVLLNDLDIIQHPNLI